MLARIPTALVVAGLAAACAPPPASPASPDSAEPGSGCPANGAPKFELGTGVDAFEPLAAGQDLKMVPGPQGGCHFWVAVQTNGFVERRFTIRYDVAFADTGASTGARSGQRVHLEPCEERAGWCEFVGFVAYLVRPWEIEDHPVRIDVEVQDDLERVAVASQTVVARWPEPVTGEPTELLCGKQD